MGNQRDQLLVYSLLSTKSALDTSEANREKDIAIELQKRTNLKNEKEIERQKPEKKIVDDSLRIIDDSLKSVNEQRILSEKLAMSQLKLKEQAEEFARRARMQDEVSTRNQHIAELRRENSEAKWQLMDTLLRRGINTDESYRIIKLFEEKDQGWQSDLFYSTKKVEVDKHVILQLYKIKLLGWKDEVLSEIDSLSLNLKAR